MRGDKQRRPTIESTSTTASPVLNPIVPCYNATPYPYHLTTYLLVIQSFFHTVFGVLFPDYPPHALVLLNSMKTDQLDFLGTSCTFNTFYLGNGPFDTVLLTLSAFLTLQLAKANPSERETLRPIAWASFVSFVVVIGLTWKFLFMAPLVFVIGDYGIGGMGLLDHLLG